MAAPGADRKQRHNSKQPGTGCRGFIREHDTGGFRVHQAVHDAGMNFAVSSQAVPASSEVVLSLAATSGATIQGALSTSGNCTIGGQLQVGGVNLLTLAQGKQDQLTTSSQLSVAKVIAAGATPSEASASAFTDLECLELMTNSVRGRPGGDLVLEGATAGPVIRIPAAGGASVAGRLTSTGGIAITGGGGNFNAGAYLRLLSSGDLVHNTATLGFGKSGVELHLFELSWLGYQHFMRPNASTAWTNTMSIESTGRWRFRKGAYVDGQLAAGSIALNGVDLATTLANLTSRISALEAA